MSRLVILAALNFEIKYRQTDTQTNRGKNPTPATAIDMSNKSHDLVDLLEKLGFHHKLGLALQHLAKLIILITVTSSSASSCCSYQQK